MHTCNVIEVKLALTSQLKLPKSSLVCLILESSPEKSIINKQINDELL